MNFIRENKVPLLVFVGVGLAFAVFLFFTFTVVQPDTFLSRLSAEDMDADFGAEEKAENWKPLPLSSNFLSLFANGVSLSAFAPNVVKILAHPAVKNRAEPIWPIVEILILAGNVVLFWIIFKKALRTERKIILLLTFSMFITLTMVVVARPNHEIIPDFDYRYAGAPYYFYAVFLALGTSILFRIKKEYATKILIPIVIIIFSLQQVFAFHSVRLKSEAKARKESIINLEKNLLVEFAVLSKKNRLLVVPNLSGEYIFEGMPGFNLAHYLFFFNDQSSIKLIKNEQMITDPRIRNVETVPSLRDGTSQAFKDALKVPGVVRNYYTSSALLHYKTINSENSSLETDSTRNKNILVQRQEFDPEKKHTLEFLFYTDDIPGNLEFLLYFDNDFSRKEKMARIKIDDYTPHVVKDGKRSYSIETDLLQIYGYALSEKISNLILSVPDVKNAVLVGIKLF